MVWSPAFLATCLIAFGFSGVIEASKPPPPPRPHGRKTGILQAQAPPAEGQAVCTWQPRPGRAPHSRCGFVGTLGRPAQIGNTFTAASEEACRDACLFKSQCKSFGYDSSNGDCYQFRKFINAMKRVKDPSSTITYNGRTCYQPASYFTTDPLLNPDFEDDGGSLSGWIEYSGSNTSSESLYSLVQPGYNSDNAASFYLVPTEPPTGDDLIEIYQDPAVCPGATYDFSFWVRYLQPADGSTTNNFFAWGVGDYTAFLNGTLRYFASGYYQPGTAPLVVGEWYQEVHTFTVDTDSVFVIFNGQTYGDSTTIEYELDEVTLHGYH